MRTKWELLQRQGDPTVQRPCRPDAGEGQELQALFDLGEEVNVLPLDKHDLLPGYTPRPVSPRGERFSTIGRTDPACPPALRRASEQVLHHHGRSRDPEGGAEGMIVTEAGASALCLFLSKGVAGIRRGKSRCSSTSATSSARRGRTGVSAGKHTIVSTFKSEVRALGKGRNRRALCGRQEVARNPWSTPMPSRSRRTKASDIGQDTRTGVAMLEYRYDLRSVTGKINKLSTSLEPT